MKAPSIAGSASGSVMRSVVRSAPAPRMLAASSISEDTMSSEDFTNTNM